MPCPTSEGFTQDKLPLYVLTVENPIHNWYWSHYPPENLHRRQTVCMQLM